MAYNRHFPAAFALFHLALATAESFALADAGILQPPRTKPDARAAFASRLLVSARTAFFENGMQFFFHLLYLFLKNDCPFQQ